MPALPLVPRLGLPGAVLLALALALTGCPPTVTDDDDSAGDDDDDSAGDDDDDDATGDDDDDDDSGARYETDSGLTILASGDLQIGLFGGPAESVATVRMAEEDWPRILGSATGRTLRDVFAICPYDIRPGAGGTIGFEVANDYGLAAGDELEVFVGHYENQDYTSVGMATVSDDGATIGMDSGLDRLTWILLADPGADAPEEPEDEDTTISATVQAQLLLDNGDPASGFFTTFCSDDTCLTGTSDAEGMVSFSPDLAVHWVIDAVGQKDHPDGAYSTYIMPVRPADGDTIDLGTLKLPLCGAHVPVK